MKKTIFRWVGLLLSVVLVCAFWTVPAFALQYGDPNQDGAINAKDALLALQVAVGKAKITDPLVFTAADVTNDKKIDAVDALYILQYAVNKRSSFPAGNGTIPDNTQPEPAEGQVAVPQLQGVNAFATPVAPVATKEAFNTLTQINQGYSKLYDLDLQCVLVYEYAMNQSQTSGGLQDSWVEGKKQTYGKNATIGLMVPINRDNGEYLKQYAGDRGMADVQTTADGSYRLHSVMNGEDVYYMVPTDAYLEYKWQVIDSYLRFNHIQVVAMEEPELWNNAGYSQGFKDAYAAYYGTAWEDPSNSAEAMWKSQYFKAYMFRHAYEVLSGRIKENYPDVSVLVTSHGNLSYCKHGISTGLSLYMSVPTIDGLIGQTWSDDASQSFAYGGNNVSSVFMNALFAYNSYGEVLTDGQTLYLLQDPASDNPAVTPEIKEENWRQTVVASLMQNDTTSFQSTIWPQRAFQAAGMDYKTVQLNVNRMFEEISSLSGQNYAGTPGVAIGLSDSLGWHLGTANTINGNSMAFVSGVYYALQNDGIPVDTVYLDNLTSVDQLQDVSVLVLSYDAVKPLSAQVNTVIAQWVKNGGRLLYLGGHDGFMDIGCEWWGQAGTTPYQHLLGELGLSGITTAVGRVSRGSCPVWAGSAFDDNSSLNSQTANRTVNFTGTGFETFMKADGKNVGITAAAGKGKVVMVGLPSAFYAQAMSNEMGLRQLVALALQGCENEYCSSTFFASSRGRYFAYYSASDTAATASDRTFVDLFSANLDVIPGGTVISRAEPKLFYDVTDFASDSIPRVGFTGGTEMADRVETADRTTYTIAYPSSSVAATVVFGNGRYPQSVSVTNTAGQTVSFITSWDEENGSLLVKANNPDVADPLTVNIVWGDAYVALSTNYMYDSFNVKVSNNTDDPLYLEGNNYSNDGCYYCDNDTYFIWRIDLEQYLQASITMDIMANYVVSVSFDNANWQTVANYADIGTPVGNLVDDKGVSYYVSGSDNRTEVTVSSNSYADAGRYMYVKVSSCYMNDAAHGHPGGDHGANVYSYTLTYLTPAS